MKKELTKDNIVKGLFATGGCLIFLSTIVKYVYATPNSLWLIGTFIGLAGVYAAAHNPLQFTNDSEDKKENELKNKDSGTLKNELLLTKENIEKEINN